MVSKLDGDLDFLPLVSPISGCRDIKALPKPSHAHKGYSAHRLCVSFREPSPDCGPFEEIGVGGKWHHEMRLVNFWRVVGYLE